MGVMEGKEEEVAFVLCSSAPTILTMILVISIIKTPPAVWVALWGDYIEHSSSRQVQGGHSPSRHENMQSCQRCGHNEVVL